MARKTISVAGSLRWVGIAQAGRIILQLVAIAVLARLLPPADFGLMAMAATVTAFAALLRDMGTGAALIQHEELSPRLIDSVFLFNLILGAGLMFATLAAGPLIANWFGDPRLGGVLAWLSPVFLLASLGIAQQALLQREERFRRIAHAELWAGLSGLVVALMLAWRDAGVYALVGQSLTTAAVSSVMFWRASPWRPSLRPTLAPLRDIVRFSGNLFLFNTANYFHRNADSMLVGRFLGPADLGIYNLAYRILLFPVQNLTFVINRALFPAYSRSQGNLQVVSVHYSRTLRAIAAVTAPLMALLWVTRDSIVRLMLGEDWLAAATIVAWLAPVGFMQSVGSTSGVVMAATGRTDVLRNMGFIGVPFLVLSFVAGLPWGTEGVAAAYCMANAIWLVPVMHVSMRVVGQGALTAWKAILPPVAVAILAVAAVLLSRSAGITKLLPDLWAFATELAIGLSVYLIGARIALYRTMRELASAMRATDQA